MPASITNGGRAQTRSPELERLVRALELVAKDLPRIMRKEKEVAFAKFDRVDLFEMHMREMGDIPARLESLARAIDKSLQVDGSLAHLSRTFQALHNMRQARASHGEEPIAKAGPTSMPPEDAYPSGETTPELPIDRKFFAPSPVFLRDRGRREIEGAGKEAAKIGPGNIIDLHLQKVRDAIVPGGWISGRSMYESSRARLVTARAMGSGPWRFQFRTGSLKWAAEARQNGLRGVAAMICGVRGYVVIDADRLLERGFKHHSMSSGGNEVLRPTVAVYGSEAILHPGAMSRTKPGQATKLGFVAF